MSRSFASRTDQERAALVRAKDRLDTLDFYPAPVDLRRVRVVHAPWWFRFPLFRHFDGYCIRDLILIRDRLEAVDDDLLCHELAHVWQQQQGSWLRMWLSFCKPRVFTGDRAAYYASPYEIEARRAVALTRATPGRASSDPP